MSDRELILCALFTSCKLEVFSFWNKVTIAVSKSTGRVSYSKFQKGRPLLQYDKGIQCIYDYLSLK